MKTYAPRLSVALLFAILMSGVALASSHARIITPAEGDDFLLQGSRYHYHQGEYDLSLKYAKTVAETSNNGEAAVFVGWHYENGLGVERDFREAAKWYELGVKRGNIVSLVHLGSFWTTGKGVPRVDHEKALGLYKAAADQGNDLGMLNYGRALMEGRGTPENLPEAISYFRQASDLGNLTAKANLAIFYLVEIPGSGVSVSIPKGLGLLEDASRGGDLTAKGTLASLYLGGKVVPKNASKAKSLFTEAANGGLPEGFAGLGYMYLEGDGVSKNLSKGATLLFIAGELKPATLANQEAVKKYLDQLDASEKDKAVQRAKRCVATSFKKCNCGFNKCF